MDEVFYKLRDKATGLFRERGVWGKWTKKGARWRSVGHIKLCLNGIPQDKINWDGWEIVEYKFQPVEAGAKELKHFL